MEVMEKQRNWEDLTSAEEELLENAETCRPERGELWERGEMSDEEKEKMEQIKEILEKKQNGEELTDEETQLLEEHELRKKDNKQEEWVKTKDYSGLSTAYRTKLDTAFQKIVDSISSYSDSKKVTALESFQTKLLSVQEKIAQSSYSDTKKTTYATLIEYLLDKVKENINEINGDEWIDDIFGDIFDEE